MWPGALETHALRIKRSVALSSLRSAPLHGGVQWIATWLVILVIGVAFWVGVAVAISGLT